MAFISCNNGNLTDIFVTDAEIIDRFVGNQLWMWGHGTLGRLGNLSTTDRSSPVQTVSTGNNWEEVSVGSQHAAAIKSDGTLWLWGEASGGRLGTNSATDVSSPVQTVSATTNWRQVSLAGCNSAAVKTDGTLWIWGTNTAGQLGNGLAGAAGSDARSSPVQLVTTGTNWRQVSLGGCHSAAVKSDGTLWLWGQGDCGKLGNNSLTNVSSPVQTVSATTCWKQVSLGDGNSAAIKTDGTLWLWGCNGNGQLGNSSTIDVSSPVQTITGGVTWKQVNLGATHSAAIKNDGTLWLWGNGACGRMGNNLSTDRSSPVQTITTGTNWKQISMGSNMSAAIKIDGSLWVWGFAACGALGNNDTVSVSSPVQTVWNGTNWKQVASGKNYGPAGTEGRFTGAVNHTDN